MFRRKEVIFSTQNCLSTPYGLNSGARHTLKLYRRSTKIRFWLGANRSRVLRPLSSFFENMLFVTRISLVATPHPIGFGPRFNMLYSLKKWVGATRYRKKSRYAGWFLSRVKLKLTAQNTVEPSDVMLINYCYSSILPLPSLRSLGRREGLPFLWQTSHFSYLDRDLLLLLGARLPGYNLYGWGRTLICGPLAASPQPVVVGLLDLYMSKMRLKKFHSFLSKQYLGAWWGHQMAYFKNDKDQNLCPSLRGLFSWNTLLLKTIRQDFLALFELEDSCQHSFYHFCTTILLPSVARAIPRQQDLNRLGAKKLEYSGPPEIESKPVQTRFLKPLEFRLLRRLVFMLTKRGERRRVYRILWKVVRSVQMDRMTDNVQELSTLLKNLRPKFSIRKKMVGRRMILLPGILPQFKKLRVVARWLVRALYLKRERSLDREWTRLLLETIENTGPAAKFKEQFEISVKHNLNNLRTGRRRRFFRRMYR